MAKLDDLNIENFESSDTPNTTRGKGKKNGGLTIVCTEKHGNRIGLNSTQILEHLSDPDRIQISFYDRYLAIGSFISEENPTYDVGRNGKNGVLYVAKLVREVVQRFGLDYSQKSSQSFPVADIKEYDTGNIIFIDMLPEENANEYGIEDKEETE